MKTKHIIGALILGCTLFACESHINDRNNEKFIIPDKGLDIDDDKTHQTPAKDDKPTTPGDVGDTPSINDSIPSSGQEEPPVAPPLVELDTKYIAGYQQDTTWVERESHVLNSHIVIQSGGELEMIESWLMEDDATITIEDGGYLGIYEQLKAAVITIKSGGILNIWETGSIILKSRESLHLEEGAIIQCNGKAMNNEGLHIVAPTDDPVSSTLEKIDSLYIESIR